MSNFVKEASIDSIEQNLIELMADFLDSDSVKLDEVIGEFRDPVNRNESELHLRMAKAAMIEYRETINA